MRHCSSGGARSSGPRAHGGRGLQRLHPVLRPAPTGWAFESFDASFLAPHGGDLAGFVLLHGERERLDEIQRSPEFERLQTRASMIVDRTGVVNAYTGEALGRLMGQFEEATAELGG